MDIATGSVKTRILIISDTHGKTFELPSKAADVAIHCGDLTDGSQIAEFSIIISLLRGVNAPIKLVIAGNHDFTLDPAAFEEKTREVEWNITREHIAKYYGAPGEANGLLERAREHGILFLGEGNHSIKLQNGATIKVFASAYTPSNGGGWGFQYDPRLEKRFDMAEDTDVVITHGPPHGVMDMSGGKRIGCPQLFAAVAKTRPLIHCFGHVHQGWGAKLATWRPRLSERPSHMVDIDHGASVLLEKLSTLRPDEALDSQEEQDEKQRKQERYAADRCCSTSHCAGDKHALKRGEQTLFVNASIMDSDNAPTQKPWVIDMEI